MKKAIDINEKPSVTGETWLEWAYRVSAGIPPAARGEWTPERGEWTVDEKDFFNKKRFKPAASDQIVDAEFEELKV